MADLTKLHDEALHTITTARKAYDECVVLVKAEKDQDRRYWLGQLSGYIADTINAAQATLYSATQALKDGVGVSVAHGQPQRPNPSESHE